MRGLTNDPWDTLSSIHRFVPAYLLMFRQWLQSISNDTSELSKCGRKEMEIPGFSFFYGENIRFDVANNTLCYPLQVLNGDCLIYNEGSYPYERILFTKKVLSNDCVVFDRVVVIPFRSYWNIFHFAECMNTLVRFFLQYNYPVVLNMMCK